jgi:hypothetical protein
MLSTAFSRATFVVASQIRPCSKEQGADGPTIVLDRSPFGREGMMSHGVDLKRRRTVLDWGMRALEGRVLLSEVGGLAPSAQVVSDPNLLRTTTSLQASTQVSGRGRSVTLVATVNAPGISRPVSSGRVRFSVVSPTPETLGIAHPDSVGRATLKTSRLHRGVIYEVQAQYLSPHGIYASSSDRLNVEATPPLVTSFFITAPRYFGAPGTPITYSVAALDRAGQPVPGYTGTIQFFSSTDRSAKFLTKTYTFTTLDQGTHAFVDGVTFQKGGAEVLKVNQVSNTRIKGEQDFGIE